MFHASFCLLSLNHISSVIPDEPEFLRHVTQLDVRDNRLSELDASLFPRLEVLHCQRNRIAHLRLRGCMLKALYASNNGTACTIISHIILQCWQGWLIFDLIFFAELEVLDVSPMASNLTYMDISRWVWVLSCLHFLKKQSTTFICFTKCVLTSTLDSCWLFFASLSSQLTINTI